MLQRQMKNCNNKTDDIARRLLTFRRFDGG